VPPRTELERSVLPSLLDRLTDTEPARPVDPATTFDASARAFRLSVQRDVEWLLNTRRSIVAVPAQYAALRDSVFEFGIPDTTGLAVGTPEGRKQLQELLQEALQRFEPRLAEARVKMVDTATGSGPCAGSPRPRSGSAGPSPERVVFDTVLEVASGVYDVGGDVPTR